MSVLVLQFCKWGRRFDSAQRPFRMQFMQNCSMDNPKNRSQRSFSMQFMQNYSMDNPKNRSQRPPSMQFMQNCSIDNPKNRSQRPFSMQFMQNCAMDNPKTGHWGSRSAGNVCILSQIGCLGFIVWTRFWGLMDFQDEGFNLNGADDGSIIP